MSERVQKQPENAKKVATSHTQPLETSTEPHLSPAALQRAQSDTRRLTPRDVMALQRSIGNRDTARLLGKDPRPLQPPVPQAKLIVGPANDRYEREADEVANRVLHVPAPSSSEETPQVQRAPIISRIQRRAPIGLQGGPVDGELEQAIQRARNGGSSLPPSVRKHLEPKLGADLASVKVHTDRRAVQLTRDLGARAFTYKNHIFYGAGQSPHDLKLTTHEAVHTIQQGAVQQTQRKVLTGVPDKTREGAPSIQRATGLPTKAEAEKAGGKAGHKVFGRSSWRKILDALDSYSKLKEDDKAGQAKKLAELQALTLQWLGSSSRAKGKKGDAKKREFLAQLRPTIKLLYYQAKTKSLTVDPARVNAETYAAENRELAMGHLKSYLEEAGVADQVDNTDALMDRILNRLMRAKLTKNIPEKVIGFLIESPDFKTCWQLANSKDAPGGVINKKYDDMSYAEKREVAERKLGYMPFTEEQRENRPDYVGINITNNPKGAAPSYGRWFFEFKDSIKNRITFTARDTFSHISDLKDVSAEKSIGTAEHMETTLAYNAGAVKVLVAQELNMGKSEAEIIKMMPFYIEGQVHGGLSVQDVETIVVDLPAERDALSDDFARQSYDLLQAFLQKYSHIRVRYKR
ncbi:MAG TPA: DUF4157 domain-containing protein [Caldilineaceae bacterium]|nr:DUF4157 domain-containing protein [Caldilineaceae bacterium]